MPQAGRGGVMMARRRQQLREQRAARKQPEREEFTGVTSLDEPLEHAAPVAVVPARPAAALRTAEVGAGCCIIM
jgi:hypothetical protein